MSCLLNAVVVSLSGDCTNSNLGGFEINIFGSAPDYSIEWLSPTTGTTALGAGVTAYTQTGLSAGTYSFNVIDSCSPTPEVFPMNINISSGTCVSIVGQQNTTCNNNNGIITAQTQNYYGYANFYLYNISGSQITSASSLSQTYVFNNLSADTYYVVADDGGGCTGKSQTCIVKSSSTLTFGLYTIPNAGCTTTSGKIYVTGLTGTPPYTYLWSNGATGSTVTGLTSGFYQVTVTDNTGCQKTEATTVNTAPAIGLGAFTSVQPSCFASDGQITVTITGGTAPYYYSGSNGSTAISFAQTHTFTGLSSGYFSVQVTDAGLCSFVATTTLLTPNAFSVLSANIINSTCSNNGGEISLTIFGGSPPYTYTLTDSLGNPTVLFGAFATAVFSNLFSDTYTLTISDNGSCTFTSAFTVSNVSLFTLTTNVKDTKCGRSNGSVQLTITAGGTAPYHYQINGQFAFSSDLNYSFGGLAGGSYVATVTDANNCQQVVPFVVNGSNNVDFILSGVDSLNGSNGSITALITSGVPPFVLNWSPNVNGQTGLTVNNLSAGTYSLSVTDSSGCTASRSIILYGFNKLSSYQTFNLCDHDFVDTGSVTRKGPQQMLIEGYYDLTSNDVNCLLNQAIFEIEATVSGVTQTSQFYTGTSITDFPSDNQYASALETLLLSFSGIGQVIVDYLNNKITVNTDCDSPLNLIDADFQVSMRIYYDINCVSCNVTTTTTSP
jgi:hypothetical protein